MTAPIKTILHIGIIAICCAACSTTRRSASNTNLLPALRPYVEEVANEVGIVSAERRVVLDAIASNVVAQLKAGKPAQMTFICTHNSRRSHLSQIWAQTAAYYYGIDKIRAFSGGTQATACNCRTVAAIRRAGFEIEDATTGDNPVYLVRYAKDRPPIRAYSKLYNADPNPKRDFIALMTCSVADKSCPVVKGAISRYAIHYADPRVCDDMPTETAEYNARCREIAREMFYVMSEVRKARDAVTVASRLSASPSEYVPRLATLNEDQARTGGAELMKPLAAPRNRRHAQQPHPHPHRHPRPIRLAPRAGYFFSSVKFARFGADLPALLLDTTVSR